MLGLALSRLQGEAGSETLVLSFLLLLSSFLTASVLQNQHRVPIAISCLVHFVQRKVMHDCNIISPLLSQSQREKCAYCSSHVFLLFLLQVNVPHDNSFNIVTVRCGLCANILYVNLEALLGKLPLQNLQVNTPLLWLMISS